MKKKLFGNIAFVSVILILLFVPAVKAFMIEGLMEIGLFKPEISSIKQAPTDLDSITFKDVNGKIVSLGDYEGKVIFLNFWATWCPPCLAEMPSINRFYEQFKTDKEVVFLFIDADSDFPKSQAFLAKKKYNFPLYTFESSLPKAIFNRTLPTTLVFDKQGRLSYKAEGAANYSNKKFIAFINELKALTQ